MMKSDKKTCAFLLPESELFDRTHTGAIKNWLAGLLNNVDSNKFDITVFGNSHKQPIEAPSKLILNKWKLAQFLGQLLFPHKEGLLYCLIASFYLKNHKTLFIENKPHYAIYLRKFGFRGKIILHMHNDFISRYNSKYQTLLAKSVDQIFCVSQAILNNYKSNQELTSISSTLPNAVDSTLFNYSPNQNKQILYLGRIENEKGVHILMDSFKDLLSTHPDWKLIIAGELNNTPYENMLIKKKIPQCEFIGRVERSDLKSLYNESSILCLPTIIKEALPSVVIEAALSGTKIVATEHEGTKEACDSNGYFCQINDSESLKKTIIEAINDNNNEKIEKAHSYVNQNYSWKSIIDKFELFLNSK